MTTLKKDLEDLISGEVKDDPETLKTFSRDASLFEIQPAVVVFPKTVHDIKSLVSYVSAQKGIDPSLSITARSAGSCMSGGAINDSIILSTTEYLNKEEVDIEGLEACVESGVFYRDFEKITLPDHITMPVYPASKRLAAFGGMIMNNCGSENSLRYGQMRDYVKSLKMVLADGNEYQFRPLNKEEREAKMAKQDFEGELYRKTFDLISNNYDLIQESQPESSKNSAGYALNRVWDRDEDIFDLGQLFVGSQGTLGVFTEAQIRLQKEKPHKKLIATFFKTWDDLPDVVNALLPYDPENLETFDRDTMKLGIRFMPKIARRAGTTFAKFALNFLPEVLIGVRMLGLPKLVVLVELAEDSKDELEKKIKGVTQALSQFKVWYRVLETKEDENKYWTMRRESFSLLRETVGDKRTAPFVEDFGVLPKHMPEFLPKVLKILKENGIKANIAGHAGNGNYHIIPLMNFDDPKERAKIVPVSDKIYKLVAEYHGTNTAEHNDGIIRTPYLQEMYGHDMVKLFEEVKHIFDPHNIFNPGKKVGGTKKDIEQHLATSNK